MHITTGKHINSKQVSEDPDPQPQHGPTCLSKLGRKTGPPQVRKSGEQARQSSPFGSDATECELEKGHLGILIWAEVPFCPSFVCTVKEVASPLQCLTSGVTYQRGLRLGELPCSRGRWIVHEQIEGRVDGLFVHAAGTLRGLQAWKNHSWVRHQPSQLLLRAESCLIKRKTKKTAKGSPSGS